MRKKHYPIDLLDVINRPDYIRIDKIGKREMTFYNQFLANELLPLAMKQLTKREKKFLLKYFRDGYTYREIGEKYNLSKTRTQIVIKRAVKKLADYINEYNRKEWKLLWNEK